MPQPMRLLRPTLVAWAGLAACGGGGASSADLTQRTQAAASAVTTAAPAAITSDGTPASASLAAAAVLPTPALPAPALPPALPPTLPPTLPPALGLALTPALPPTLPRPALAAADLAVLIAEGDALSEAIGLAYQRARGIPDANLVRVPVPAGSDVISESAFATLKAAIDAKLPAQAQATLVTWAQPSRVQGACSMGITSALAFGYSAAQCGGCARTTASAYFDSDSSQPYTDLQIRPSMMLGAATLHAALALINRGVAADGSQPAGTGYLLRTRDAARSVRHTDYLALPAAWASAPGLALRTLDASLANPAGLEGQFISQQSDVLFYFTGLASVPQMASNQFLPGAAADHLTSFAGLLPGGNGQMPATDWLAAGATASYGTVEEPCNHVEKFPKASVLIEHYLRGATLIEAYWKSVAWPGQGLFVGEPLARPWNQPPTALIEGHELVLRTRSLRRHGTYRVEFRAAGSSAWVALASLTAGQPRPITWRVALPASTAGGRLRWLGPCVLAPSGMCVLGESG